MEKLKKKLKKVEEEANELETVYKLSKRKKIPYKDALTNFKYQKLVDEYREKSRKSGDEEGVKIFSNDVISDKKLSDREGSYKKGGLVRAGKPKLAKKGWR
jgi:hypothetical protein